jgi:hypothetical protein
MSDFLQWGALWFHRAFMFSLGSRFAQLVEIHSHSGFRLAFFPFSLPSSIINKYDIKYSSL